MKMRGETGNDLQKTRGPQAHMIPCGNSRVNAPPRCCSSALAFKNTLSHVGHLSPPPATPPPLAPCKNPRDTPSTCAVAMTRPCCVTGASLPTPCALFRCIADPLSMCSTRNLSSATPSCTCNTMCVCECRAICRSLSLSLVLSFSLHAVPRSSASIPDR